MKLLDPFRLILIPNSTKPIMEVNLRSQLSQWFLIFNFCLNFLALRPKVFAGLHIQPFGKKFPILTRSIMSVGIGSL